MKRFIPAVLVTLSLLMMAQVSHAQGLFGNLFSGNNYVEPTETVSDSLRTATDYADSSSIKDGGVSITDLTSEITAWFKGFFHSDDAAAARDSLGLGTMAIQDADNVAITGGVVSGTNILLDGDDLTNGLYRGLTDSLVAGENLAIGDVCYLHTSGKLLKAQANSSASAGACVVALETITANAMGLVLRTGYLKLDAWTTVATIGAAVYVDDDTAGLATTTVPPDAGDAVFQIGSCAGTDLLYFNPPPPSMYVVRQ